MKAHSPRSSNVKGIHGDFRRNIATRGVRLNSLVGKQFDIGSVRLEGIRLSEPCTTLAATVSEDVLPGLVGRGGLRVRIVKGGRISVGNVVQAKVS